MRALLTKDFLVLTKQLKVLLVLIPIMLLTGGSFMASFAILIGAALPMTSFAYDEQSRWNELAAMLPYSDKDLVLSKYVLGYLCMAATALLSLAAELVLPVLGVKTPAPAGFILPTSCTISLLLIAINLPILRKFGAQKGRIVFILVMGFAGGLISILSGVTPENLSAPAEVMPWLALVLAAALNLPSIYISLRIQQH